MNRRYFIEAVAALLLAPALPVAAKPKTVPEIYTVTISPSDDDNASIKAAMRDIQAHGGGTIILTDGTFFFNEPIDLRSSVPLNFLGGKAILDFTSKP